MYSGSVAEKKKRLFYSADDDLHLLREVCGQNPYLDRTRWGLIRCHIKELTGKDFSERSLKERIALLIEKFKERIKNDEYKSGIEEEVTEIDDLLHQILLLIEEFSRTKSENKSSFQKGYEKREQALQTTPEIEICNIDETELIEICYLDEDSVTVGLSNDDQAPAEVNIDKENSIQPTPTTTVRGKGKCVKRGRGGVLTPSRQRNTGIKQTSIRFLEIKNDRWYEIRKRELDLEEKKFQFEKEERKRKLAIDEARLDLEQKRFTAELNNFSHQQKIMNNQQKLMEMAFQARIDK